VDARDLDVERVGRRRQQPLDAQRAAISQREGAALVEMRAAQQVGAGRGRMAGMGHGSSFRG